MTTATADLREGGGMPSFAFGAIPGQMRVAGSVDRCRATTFTISPPQQRADGGWFKLKLVLSRRILTSVVFYFSREINGTRLTVVEAGLLLLLTGHGTAGVRRSLQRRLGSAISAPGLHWLANRPLVAPW